MKELSYGPVTHLVTEIVSKFVENGHDRRFFDCVADEIQPTPALAGYPRAYAISEIERFESWPRYLYAGCLNIAEIRLNMTYGIIRCVHFDREKWSIYTGSGVTADSYPSVEWEETELKAAPLVKCLEKSERAVAPYLRGRRHSHGHTPCAVGGAVEPSYGQQNQGFQPFRRPRAVGAVRGFRARGRSRP